MKKSLAIHQKLHIKRAIGIRDNAKSLGRFSNNVAIDGDDTVARRRKAVLVILHNQPPREISLQKIPGVVEWISRNLRPKKLVMFYTNRFGSTRHLHLYETLGDLKYKRKYVEQK